MAVTKLMTNNFNDTSAIKKEFSFKFNWFALQNTKILIARERKTGDCASDFLL